MQGESAETEAKIVDAVYRGACDTVGLSRAIEMIAEYFGAAGVALGDIDQLRPECQVMLSCGAVDIVRYQDYLHLDPIPPAYARLSPGTMTTASRILAENERNGQFLNEFLVPLGVDDAMGGPLFRAEGRFAAISVLKGINQDDFGDDDIARLARLTPHVTRTLQIRRLFLQSEARGKTLESIVDRNETGLIGLRTDGTVVFVNAAIRAMAAARDGVSLDRLGRLIVFDRGAATQLTALQADVLRGGCGGVVRIPRPTGHPPYVVLVSPLPGSDDVFPPGVLFAIHDPMRRPAATAQRVAQVLHLPFGAAKVVQALLEGFDLKEYADCAGLSVNTVRTHLRTAFERTDTRSQVDLVRKALQALNDLGPYFTNQNRS